MGGMPMTAEYSRCMDYGRGTHRIRKWATCPQRLYVQLGGLISRAARCHGYEWNLVSLEQTVDPKEAHPPDIRSQQVEILWTRKNQALCTRVHYPTEEILLVPNSWI